MILKHIFFYFQQKKSQKVRGFKKHKAKVNLTYFLSHEENKGFTLIAVRSLKKKKKNWHPHFSISCQSKAMQECEDPPGATSSDFLSEAAKVSLHLSEWKILQDI